MSKSINDLIGILVFGFTLARLPDVMFIFLDFLTPANVVAFIRQLHRLTNFFGFIISAVIVNNKVIERIGTF